MAVRLLVFIQDRNSIKLSVESIYHNKKLEIYVTNSFICMSIHMFLNYNQHYFLINIEQYQHVPVNMRLKMQISRPINK